MPAIVESLWSLDAEYFLLLGLMAFGASAFRAKFLPRWLALALLILTVNDLLTGPYLDGPPPASPLLISIPWFALGLYLLWSRDGRNAPPGA